MNIMEKITATEKTMNPGYSLRLRDIKELMSNAGTDSCKLACIAFTYGYLQGTKAEKAGARKSRTKTKSQPQEGVAT